MKNYLWSALIGSVLLFSGCSGMLDQEPSGSILSQNQYDNMDETVLAHVRGLYASLIESSDYDAFGQKSIDIATDLMSCDMAMSAQAYGWYEDAALMTCATSTSSRTSYIWNYYYQIIHNCNLAISNVLKKDVDNDSIFGHCYAEALTMRGYAYSHLAELFCRPAYSTTSADLNTLSVPIYTENTPDKTPQPLATLGDLYNQIEFDLTTAIVYFDKWPLIVRDSKLKFNADVARGLLAYAYLNKGDYENAYLVAETVINDNHFTIIPYAQLLTTGFVSVDNPSWMWGSLTTIENSTFMASFWGQVDIHTYGYAFAGCMKVIDDLLYATIPETDGRKAWFNASKELVPDWKFYDLKRGSKTDDVDRDWLNDNVFMRVEEMYLIAAEAAFRSNEPAMSKAALQALLQERDVTVANSLSTADLEYQIYYNWRIEMWGEGKALQVFKRFQMAKKRGSNHFEYKNTDVNPNDLKFVFAIPYSELTTNPELE